MSSYSQAPKPSEPRTRPGVVPTFKSDRFSNEEKSILRRLSADWYLTNHGDDVKSGTSTYRYFLLKPSDRLREILNFDREIVAVFSAYDKFEPRSLQSFDAAYKNLPGKRLEKICQILISKDPTIVQRISALVETDPESPIIIPIYYNDAALVNDSEMDHRLRSSFYSRDIFALQSPLTKDTYFFGRSHLIRALVDRRKSQENSGLFGLRKSGKTSIIYGVERALNSQSEYFLTIDCQNPTIHRRRWNELLFQLVRDIKNKYNLPTKISSETAYDEKNAAALFETDMQAIHKSLDKKSILIIFDEIERISPVTGSSDHWKSGDDFVYFWQTLRSVFQKNRDLYTYLLVGTNPAAVESDKVNSHDNPIFSSISINYVPGFTTDQVTEMVSRIGGFMGLTFDDQIYSSLTEDFGGHPFLIRQFCSKMHRSVNKRRPFNVDKSVYNKTKEAFDQENAPYIEMILDVLKSHYTDEYEMARYLAADDHDSFNALAESSPTLVNHLLGYELIKKGAEGYWFNIEAVKSYLVKAHKFERIIRTDEEKIAEISERRNSLESQLRQVIKQQIKARDGKIKGLQTVLSSIDENRRPSLQGYDLDKLLHSKESPLFLKDLMNLLAREWEAFKNIFEMDKSRLINTLDDINKMRSDAHAKKVDDSDFNQIRIHFTKLESMLQEWAK